MSMPKRKTLDFPTDLASELESKAKENDTSFTALVVQAVRIFLGHDPEVSPVYDDSNLEEISILEHLEKLNNRLDKLEYKSRNEGIRQVFAEGDVTIRGIKPLEVVTPDPLAIQNTARIAVIEKLLKLILAQMPKEEFGSINFDRGNQAKDNTHT